MRFLFRKLKLKYIISIIIIGVILQFAFTILKSPYLEFSLERSSNPKASEHFINAMQYKFMINTVHKIVDYDNFLMKPLLNKMNEEYEKGKKLLPENSAEDVYWYVALYRGIHGIGGIPDKYDMSMAYKNIFTKEEYEIHYKEIVNKIKRLATDDFIFDVPRVNQYKYEFMVNLVDEIKSTLNKITNEDKKALQNEDYLKDLINIYIYIIGISLISIFQLQINKMKIELVIFTQK